MNTLLKSLGIIILLIGVGVLAIPAFTDMRNNTVLAVGLGAILLGFIAHIFLNKKFE
ncbi:MAG: hypothetical protein LBV74_17630 [Tannerella sp.]|nr:hypothetical protein [Tannerella sp.]